MPAKSVVGSEVQFDQRLFNQAAGLGHGYGDDEAYNVYDKPWRESGSLANHLYRPTKGLDKEVYGGPGASEELDKLVRTERFVPDKEFSGAEHSHTHQPRTGPLHFEKEEDPFGLDQFLSQAKKSSKRKEPQDTRTGRQEDREKRKRRD